MQIHSEENVLDDLDDNEYANFTEEIRSPYDQQ